jgi:ribonucleoside-diphosphate reductase alpha chain
VQLSQNAMTVLKARYLKGDETPEQRLMEVAYHVAQAEKKSVDWVAPFYSMMLSLKFLPNTPCIANAGRKNGQLNACFVLPVADALTTPEGDGIMDIARATALIHQTGGGTGFDFSSLRPRGFPVASSNGVASGPVSFMRLFDSVTDTIKQGGIRRGANMGILRIDHPDIEEFIDAKQTEKGLNNFNISVAVTDSFMEAVRGGGTDERRLWKKIANAAWTHGDPGVFYIDRANKDNPLDFPIRATNPCGEIPMPDWDACNLGSINLAKFVGRNGLDGEAFAETVVLATRFLDDVVEVNTVAIPQIQSFTKQTRRLGLGIMGWADYLNALGIPYDSEEAVAQIEVIGQVLRHHSDAESKRLAGERGAYPLSKDGVFRNVARRSIAPTGSISTIADCSAGIEPIFAASVERKVAIGTLREVNKHAGQPYFRTAMQIDPSWHVRHQAEWQKYIDNGVSKTVNMDNTRTPDDVAAIYEMAWHMGCKGITIYRDGSRSLQVYNQMHCVGDACEIPSA